MYPSTHPPTYLPVQAAATRREMRMERRQRDSLVGLFEGDEEEEEGGGDLDLGALGTGLEGKNKGLDISFDFEDDEEEEEGELVDSGSGEEVGNVLPPTHPPTHPFFHLITTQSSQSSHLPTQ